MNWQIIVGGFLFIGGLGNLTEDFGAFLFGVLIGGCLLYWGLRQKGLINKTAKQIPAGRTLTEETLHAVGVSYYEDNIQKLACKNPDWQLSAEQIVNSGKAGKRIFRHTYINRPVKLVLQPDNEHDPNAVAVIIAGELVGYISREDNLHVKDILENRDIKSLSGFIGGGEYKIVGKDGDITKDEYGFSVNIRIKYI